MKNFKRIAAIVMAVVVIAAMSVTSFAAGNDTGYPKTVIDEGVQWKFVKSGSYWNIISVETGEYLAKVSNLSVSETSADLWEWHDNVLERRTNTGGTVHIGSGGRFSLGTATDTYIYQRKVEGNTVKYEKADTVVEGEIYLLVGVKDGAYHCITNTHNGKSGTTDCRLWNLEVTADGNYVRSLGATEDETIAVEDTEAATEAPATEAPATDAPATEAPATAAPTTTDSTTASQTSDVALVSGLGVLALSAAAIVCLNKKRG